VCFPLKIAVRVDFDRGGTPIVTSLLRVGRKLMWIEEHSQPVPNCLRAVMWAINPPSRVPGFRWSTGTHRENRRAIIAGGSVLSNTPSSAALVNEAYLRLVDQRRSTQASAHTSLAVAPELMRSDSGDHARGHGAANVELTSGSLDHVRSWLPQMPNPRCAFALNDALDDLTGWISMQGIGSLKCGLLRINRARISYRTGHILSSP